MSKIQLVKAIEHLPDNTQIVCVSVLGKRTPFYVGSLESGVLAGQTFVKMNLYEYTNTKFPGIWTSLRG